MKKGVILSGQLSFFDDMGIVIPGVNINCWERKATRQRLQEMVKKDGIESYLQKGEKILSLAREKATKTAFKQSSFLECFNFKSLSGKKDKEKMEYILSCIKKRMIAPAMEHPFDKDKGILSLIPGFSNISVTKVDEACYESDIIRLLLMKKRNTSYVGTLKFIAGNMEPFYMPIGSINRLSVSENGRSFRKQQSSKTVACADGPHYLALLVLFAQLMECVHKRLSSLSQEEMKSDIIYVFLSRTQEEYLKAFLKKGPIRISPDCACKKYIRDYLEQQKIPFQVAEEDSDDVMKTECFLPALMLSTTTNTDEWKFVKERRRKRTKKTVSYETSLSVGIDRSFILCLFERVFHEYFFDKQNDEIQKKLESEYAHSFETKHAIPEKVLNAMKRSGWNEYFGYVEFDEDCDLDRVEELVKEFTALSMKLNWTKKEEVSVRFRKLGQHKASGLYYPGLKCMCIDIHTPFSMVHEYFHMLDYEAHSASRRIEFYDLYDRYSTLLTNYAKRQVKDHPLNKKSKYNLDYFLEPTEVFARCGEIYLVRILQIDNSLVKPEEGYAYPNDSELNKLIEEYYLKFLGI